MLHICITEIMQLKIEGKRRGKEKNIKSSLSYRQLVGIKGCQEKKKKTEIAESKRLNKKHETEVIRVDISTMAAPRTKHSTLLDTHIFHKRAENAHSIDKQKI